MLFRSIAQGSSELTIVVVVHRDGLDQAVRAVHEECGLGSAAAEPVGGPGSDTGSGRR